MKNYPFIGCSIAFIFGILANNYFNLSSQVSALALIILIFLLTSLHRILAQRNTLLFLGIYLSFFLFGILMLSIKMENKSFLPDEFESNEKIVVVGIVKEVDLIRTNEILFLIRTDSIRVDTLFEARNVHLLCKVRDNPENLNKLYDKLLPGNKLWIKGIYQRGREKKNPGEYDYDLYLKTQNISGLFYIIEAYEVKILDLNSDLFKTIVLKIRKTIDWQIRSLHNEQTAGLLRGLLLADRSGIDYKAKEEFVNSGVIHILAVSGLHVGFIVIIFITAFGRFNVLLRSILTTIGLIAFMIITEMPPSVFRAVTMAVVIILSYLLNRSTNIFNSLAIAAFIVLAVNPEDLFSPGFQLSFSAVLSIAVIYPIIQKLINAAAIKSKVINYILLFMGVSLSAQIGTLPFTLIYFGKLSLVSLIANLFVIPLVGLIVGVAIFTVLISFLSTYIASIFSVANELLTFILFKTVSIAGGGEYSFVYVRDFTAYDTLIFYLAIISIILAMFRLNTFKGKAAAISLIILNSVVLGQFDNKKLFENDKLNVFVTDLSAGSSVLIKFPDGSTSLINAGRTSFYFDNFERIVKPLLIHTDINRIDLAVLSNMNEQNASGFSSLIKSGMVKKILTPNFDSTTVIGSALNQIINSIEIEYERLIQRVFEFGGAKYYFLIDSLNTHKGSFYLNTVGLIKLVFGKTSILFHNGVSNELENYICDVYKSFLKSDVLIFSEFQDNTTASVNFLRNVLPKYVLFGNKRDKVYNKMHSTIIERLKKLNHDFQLIEDSEAVHLVSDGKEIMINRWKN